MAEGEKLVAEFTSVRHKKQDGVLLLTSARVAWSAGELFQVNYPYHQIKGQNQVGYVCSRLYTIRNWHQKWFRKIT